MKFYRLEMSPMKWVEFNANIAFVAGFLNGLGSNMSEGHRTIMAINAIEAVSEKLKNLIVVDFSSDVEKTSLEK